MRLRRRAARRRHRAVLADAADVVAHQVDDHHVLGRVLVGVPQPSQRLCGERRIAGTVGGALDRAAADAPALATQEQLGRERHDAALRRVERRRVLGDDSTLERAAQQRARRALILGVEPQADVGLEDLAGSDPLAARGDGLQMVGGDRGLQAQRSGHRRRGGRRGEARLDDAAPHMLEPFFQIGPALGRRERLEPPEAVGVLMHDVVVVGEVEVGQRHRPRVGQRHLLDACRQAVPEPAEPTATDRVGRGRTPVDRGQIIEQRERIIVRLGDTQRLGRDDRSAPGPRA